MRTEANAGSVYPTGEQTAEFEALLRQIPEDYERYRSKRQSFLDRHVLTTATPVGRPRKDLEASEAARLHAEGVSWKQIAVRWDAPVEELDREADRIRKLVKLRENPPGNKSE